MNMVLPQASAARCAALTLHALAEVDRRWVLEGLPRAQRESLQPLLQELRELGMPGDATLLDAFTALPGGAGSPPGAEALLALDAPGVHRLAAVLAAEPPRVGAALLANRRWPWQDLLLRELPAPHACALQQLVPTAAGATALQAQVIRQAAQSLSTRTPAPARSSRWEVLRQKLRALGRST